MAVVGVVKSITGQAIVVNERGERHILKVGEKLQAGEQIVTGPGATVGVQLANGKMVDLAAAQTIKITQNLAQSEVPDAGENAVNQATIESVIQAVAEGRDIDEVLNAPAAGPNAAGSGSDGNATFVNLERINVVDPSRSSFDGFGGSGFTRGGEGDNRGNDDARNTRVPATPNGFQAIDDVDPVQGLITNNSVTNDTRPEFTGTGARPGDVITVLDGGLPIGSAVVNADGTWSVTPTTPLSETTHTITTIANDPQTGNTSAPSAPLTFIVDTTAPTDTSIGDIIDDVGLKTGPIGSNGVTDDNTPTITGKGEPNATITVTDNGQVLGTAIVKADGTWSLTPTTPLAEGAHSITVTATDPAGNTSPATAPATFTVDTSKVTDPTINAATDNTDPQPGTVAPGGFTNDTTPTLTGSAPKGTTVEVFAKGPDGTNVSLGTVTTDANGQWTLTPSTPLAKDGQYDFTAQATNIGTGAKSGITPVYSLNLDTVAPVSPSITSLTDDVGTPQGTLTPNSVTDDTTPTINGRGEKAGDTIQVYDGATLIGSTTVKADGTWSLTPTTTLTEGVHNLTAKETDAAGNVSPASTPFAVTVDTTAPTVPSITGVADDVGPVKDNIPDGGSTDDTTPTVTGTGEPGSLITVFDGKTPVGSAIVKADGTWSVDTPLLNGSHPLTAVATDPAGNSSAPSATYTINVDTNGPVEPAIVRIDDDQGTPSQIQKDGVTDDSTPTIVGTAGANLKINIYDNGVLIGSTTTNANGDWTYTPSTPLKEGLQNIQAAAVSAAGVEGGKTGDFKFTIDTTAPTDTSIGDIIDDVGLKTGPIGSNGVTDDNTPTITGKGEPNATITVTDNGQVLGTAIVKADGTWSLTPTTPLAEGAHSITVTATDPAGNTSPATAPATFTVDTSKVTDPTINAATDNTDPQPGTVAPGGFTNDTTPTLTGSAPKGTTVEVFAKGPDGTNVSLGTVTTDANGQWTLTPSTPLAKDGQYDFTAQATNIGTGAKSGITPVYSLNLDTVAPVSPSITSLTDDVGTPQGTLTPNSVTDDTTPTINGRGEKAGDTIQVYDGATLIGSTTVKADGTWSLTPTTTLTEGVHNLTAKETDAAGNVSPASTPFAVTVDTTAPTVPSITGVADDVGPVKDNIPDGGSTDDTTPTVTGTGEPGSLITVFDGKTPVGSAIVKADGTWSVDTPLLNGSHPLTAVATDPAGNSSAPSATYTINVDTNGPVEPAIVRIDDDQGTPSQIQKDGVTDDSTPTIVGTAGANLKINIYDNGVLIGSTTTNANGDWTYTPSTPLKEGLQNIQAAAVSAAGVEGGKTGDFKFTIDTTAPTDTSIGDIIDDVGLKTGPIGSNGVTDDNTPTITGKGEPNATITVTDNGQVLGTAIVKADGTWSLTPTTPLAEGAHSITVTATDPAGNTSPATAPATFTVDTSKVTDPTINAATDNTDPQPGTVAPGGFTNDTTPTLTGSAPKGTTVEVFAKGPDGTNVSLGTVTTDANGQWTLTPSTPLAKDGQYDFTAQATNIGTGAKSGITPVYSLNLDTVAPVSPSITSLTDDVGTPQGTLTPNSVTDDTTPTINGRGEKAGDTIQVYDGATLIGSTTVKADGTWSLTPTTTLTEGVHNLTAKETDAAGNVSPASTPFAVTVDTTAPTVPSITGVADDVGPVKDNIPDGGSTDDTTPTVTGTGEPGSLITVFDGKTPVGSAIVKADGTWSVDTPLLNGSHPLTAVATDPAGNSSAPSATYTINVDTNGPVEPAIVRIDDDQGTPSQIQKDGVTDDSTPTIVGTAGANLKINIYDNGVLIGSTTTNANGDWTYTPSTPLKEGLQNIQAAAVSAAGVEGGKTGDFKFTIDTTAPTDTSIGDIIDDVGLKTGPIGSNGVTDDNTPTITGKGEPNATITVTDNGQVLGTAIVKADGTWSLTPTTPLAEGAHSITVTATDPAGNTSPATAPATFTVDTSKVTDPTINAATDNTDPQPGTVAPGGFTNDTTPTLTGSAPKGTTVEVFAKGPDGTNVSLGTVTTDANGQWTLTPSTPLAKDGQYDFTAQATNIGTGAKSGITPVYSLNLDTVAPVSPSITSLTDDVGTPQGTLNPNSVTDDTTPTINGRGEKAGDTIQVYDGATLIGSTTVKADGTWSLTPTTTLTEGVHNLTAKETDAAGNVSPASTPFAVTVDTTAPTVPSITGVADDVGPVKDNIPDGGSTDDTTPTVTGTGEPGSLITVFDGKTPVGSAIVKADGTWSVDTPLLNGSHPLTAVATDPAGNSSAPSATYTINVDTNGPVEPAIVRIDDDQGTPSQIQKDGVTDDSTPTIVGTAGANLKINIYDNGVLIGSTTTNANGDWTYTPSTPLKEGLQNIQAAAVSAAGVEGGKTGDFKFTIDTTAPTDTSIGDIIDDVGLKTGPIGSNGVTDDNTPTITGKGEPNATITVTDNGQVLGTAIVKADGTWSLTPTTPLAEGAHSITVTATDPAGNTSPATAPATFTVDTSKVTDPTINAATDNTDPQPGTVAPGGFTNDTTPTLTGSAPKGTTVEVFAKGPDGTNVSLGTVTTDANGQWTLTPSTPLAKDGQYDFTAQATNIGTGAKSGITPVYSLNLDTVAPVSPSITSLTDDVGTPQGTLTPNSVTDDTTPTINGRGEKAGDTIQVYDGATLIGSTTVKADGTWSLTPTTTLTEGVHNLTAKETDAAGNVSPASTPFAVTVDTTAPTVPSITGVADDVGPVKDNIPDGGSTDDTTPTVTGTGEPGSLITVFDGKTPVGSAIVKADGTWSVDTPLLNGSHPLTAVATDPAGNSSAPSATYTINVDTNGPVEPAIVRIDDDQAPQVKSKKTA